MHAHITKEDAMNKVRENGFNIKYLPIKFKQDIDVIKEALLNNIDVIGAISLKYWTDVELIKYILQNKYHKFDCFHCMPEIIRFNKEIALLTCKYYIKQLDYTNQEFRSDREFMSEIIKYNGYGLIYASDDIKQDKQLVLAALNCPHNTCLITLTDIPNNLRSDKDVVIAAVQLYGKTLKDASFNLRSDRDVVLAAVKNKGMALEFASANLNADREIVLAAINQDGDALEFASNELKADRDICNIAVKNSDRAFIYLSEELQFDKSYITELLNYGNPIYKYIPDIYKSDSILIYLALICDGTQLKYVPLNENTEERCLLAVKENGFAIRFCQNPTPKIVTAAIIQTSHAFNYIPAKYRSKFKYIVLALSQSFYILTNVLGKYKDLTYLSDEITDMIHEIEYEKRKFYLCIYSVTLPFELKKIIWDFHGMRTLNENHIVFKKASKNLLIYNLNH